MHIISNRPLPTLVKIVNDNANVFRMLINCIYLKIVNDNT